jgi:hypothetical protein
MGDFKHIISVFNFGSQVGCSFDTPCYNLKPSITNVLFQVEFQWRVFDNAA